MSGMLNHDVGEYEAAQRARIREIKARLYRPAVQIAPAPLPIPRKIAEPAGPRTKRVRARIKPTNPEPSTPFPAYMREPKPIAILRFVAKRYGLSEDELRHDTCTQQFVRARHIGFWLSRKLTTRTLAHIARVFGKQDHTTCRNGFLRIEQRREKDRALKAETDRLCKVISAARVEA